MREIVEREKEVSVCLKKIMRKKRSVRNSNVKEGGQAIRNPMDNLSFQKT